MEDDPENDMTENTFMYPRIENIYSDAKIKTEPMDDDDDYNSIEIVENSSEYYMPFPNKIILGSKPSSVAKLEPTPGPSTAPDHWEDQNEENVFECAECNIVFPTQNEMDSHETTVHSFLVARPISKAIRSERDISLSSTSSRSYIEEANSQEGIRRQKAKKSTAKSSLNKTFPIIQNVNTNPYPEETAPVSEGFLCKHCNVRFPDEITLIKHTYELLPENQFNQSKDKTPGKRDGDYLQSNDNDLLLQCLYCTCVLMYPGFMKKHLLNNHKTTDYAVKRVPYSGKCPLCSRSFNDYKQYNKHLLKYHRKVFRSRVPLRLNATMGKLKCLLCNQIFPTRYSAYKHKAEKHPGQSQKHTFNAVSDKPVKQLTAYPSKKALTVDGTCYIPKSNIFKCNKCQIYFVSCSAAFAHAKRCVTPKLIWRCQRCRRNFNKLEKVTHTQQHQISEKFKVHTVGNKILDQVLCKCPKCELLFDGPSFTDHAIGSCVAKTGIECKSCNLRFHTDSFAKHRRCHSKYKFSGTDFIIIEYCEVSLEKKELEDDFKQKFMYCSTCRCHFYKVKFKESYHLTGLCADLVKKSCALCGLSFSRKPFLKHMKFDHDTFNLKLDDFKFISVENFKVINPAMPDFFQCENCEVRFVSQMGRNHHKCSKQVFVKCSKCSQKFDSVTYDIHMAYHNYRRANKQVEDSSVVKFFACVACNYGFHSYDEIVEHCQKHYINVEKVATRPCRLCNLNYATDHKTLHSNSAKFEIYKFDYAQLLTNDWLDGFGCLEKNVLEDILSNSVYGVLRNVHLELLVEGPAVRTLYKCAQCELNFNQDDVSEHTMDSCNVNGHFECNSCNATFKTRAAKTNHMNIHVVYGDDITFREVVFNYEKDKELNDALRTGRPKESLKFRKCLQCKLLIKKSDYQAHISAHNSRIEMKQYIFRRDNKVITYNLVKPANGSKKLYTVYKCINCNACIMKKANMARHKCAPSEKYEKCSKCSLYFLAWNIKRHIAQHATIPKFIPKNIAVLQFQLLGNKENSKKRRRYSSDDDASATESQATVVSKTYETRKVIGRPYSDNLSDDSQDGVISASKTSTSNAYAKKYIKKSYVEITDCGNGEELNSKAQDGHTTQKLQRSLSESLLNVEIWKSDMKCKLYQCEKCYSCFAHKQLLVSHLLNCDDSLTETPLYCDQCDTVFHPSDLSFHEKLHELARENVVEDYFYLIYISTNGIDTNNDKRWLYKCKLCDVHYLCTKSSDRHFSLDHNGQDYYACELCGLRFTQISRTRHLRLQHNEGKWSKNDLHIEIIEKKTLKVGEIQLKAIETQTVQENCRVEIDEISRDEQLNVSRAKIVDSAIRQVATDADEVLSEGNKTVNEEIADDEMEMEESAYKSEIVGNRLYKCDKCEKHYTIKAQLLRHNINAAHKVKPHPCGLCGLTFGKRTLAVHKRIQHDKLKLKREDFVVVKLGVNENEKSSTDVLDTSQNRDGSNTIDVNVSNEEKLGRLTEQINEVKSKVKLSGVSDPIDNRIYKCVECSVYYTNRRTLYLHIVLKKHKQILFSKCKLCGLSFGKGSLQKHINVQHNKLKLARKDFIIRDVFETRIDDENEEQISKNRQATEHGVQELGNKEVVTEVSEHVNEKENDKKIILKIYQCKDCKVCVQKPEIKFHVCCSDIQKKYCIQCCLSFRYTDNIQHMRLHRNYPGLSRKNFTLIRFGRRTDNNNKIYKCVSCSTHFINFTALECHMNVFKHQTKREFCVHCGLFFGTHSLRRHLYIHHKKLNLTVQKFNIIHVSNTDTITSDINLNGAEKSRSGINTVSERDSTPNLNTAKKLFKCVECDVYFLTRATYYHHIYKHRKLDTTEFIDCNICDLQFLNESLGVHMKSHKDKSFCLDKFLIEEYQPNSTEPKIEFYFAKDGLNSKLVSTTTPFDNDDDMDQIDEQLSVIDSTSDEPKTKDDEMSNLDSNVYPINDGACNDGITLKSPVELPNN